MELGGLELGGEALDTADGEMKKSEELLGKRAGWDTSLDLILPDRLRVKLQELQQPNVQY